MVSDRFKGREWLRLPIGQPIQFKLKNWIDIVGEEDFQLWDNNAKRYNTVDKFTKGRSRRVIREIIVNGKEMNWGTPSGVDNTLKQIFETMKATNQDPLKAVFEISKTGTGLSTKYKIRLLPTNKPVEEEGLDYEASK